jgi:hypothetical protein
LHQALFTFSEDEALFLANVAEMLEGWGVFTSGFIDKDEPGWA